MFKYTILVVLRSYCTYSNFQVCPSKECVENTDMSVLTMLHNKIISIFNLILNYR